MSNVVYSHIMSRDLLYNLFVRNSKYVDEGAKQLRVPYNSLLNQLKHKLTPEEYAKVKFKRRRFTSAEKAELLHKACAPGGSFQTVAEDAGIPESQLQYWRKRHSKLLHEYQDHM